MTISSEMLLIVGVFALYFYDSASLLYANELVLSESNRRFSATVGSNAQIGGRFVYMPSILTPHHGQFKGTWILTDDEVDKEFVPGLLQFADALALPKLACLALAALLFLVLPTLLLFNGPPLAFFALLASVYSAIGVMAYSAFKHRRALELTNRQLAMLACEAFLCPPFAVNFVRKVCELRGLRQDALTLAERLLPRAHQAALLAAVRQRIEVQMAFADESSAAYEEMRRFNDRLRERQP